MAKFKVNCSNCSQTLEADEAWIGMELPCPMCGKKFKLQKPTLQVSAKSGGGGVRGVTDGVMKVLSVLISCRILILHTSFSRYSNSARGRKKRITSLMVFRAKHRLYPKSTLLGQLRGCLSG